MSQGSFSFRPLSILLLCCLLPAVGCALPQYVMESMAKHHELRAEQNLARSQSLEARAEKREREHQAALTECEENEMAARRETIDSLRSKLSFDLDQRFVMSKLEVDSDQLKQMMAKRDKDYEQIKNLWDEMEAKMLEARSEEEARQVRQYIQELAKIGEEAGCCEKCNWHVCHKKCRQPCEDRTLLPALPAKRPITPVDIPMVIRVKWQMGMENPQVEDARIRQLPALPALPAKPCCEKNCGRPDCNSCATQSSYHQESCTNSAVRQPPVAQIQATDEAPPVPPAPVPSGRQ